MISLDECNALLECDISNSNVLILLKLRNSMHTAFSTPLAYKFILSHNFKVLFYAILYTNISKMSIQIKILKYIELKHKNYNIIAYFKE
jgi:hypothetical protein